MAERVNYDPDYDPSDVERCVIFLKSGSFARMVRRTEKITVNGEKKIRFYLVTTKATSLKLGLKEKQRNDVNKGIFDSVNGYYIKDIPETWIQIVDTDPSTLRFYAFCDWDVTEFYNPSQDMLESTERILRSVTQQRNAYAERIASLERALGRAGKYGDIHRKAVFDELAEQQKKLNPLAQANVNPQGNVQ